MKLIRAIVAVLLLGSSLHGGEVKLLAVGRPVKNGAHPVSGRPISDGFLVSVYAINLTGRVIALPSRFDDPEQLSGGDFVQIRFCYLPRKFHTSSGDYPVIPSRESFAPVTLLTGECLLIEPKGFLVEKSDVRGRKLTFCLWTSGLLAERLGFEDIRVETEMIVLEQGKPLPKELR